MWTITGYPVELLAFAAVVAVLLAVLFLWMRRFVVPLLHGRGASRAMSKWLPRVEISTWVVFTAALSIALIQADPLLTLVIIGLVGVVGWSIWKDLFTGLYFRLAGRFLPGDPINTGTIVGKVVRAATRDLEVVLNDGSKVWIPYSKLASDVIGQQTTATNLQRRTFQTELPGVIQVDAQHKIKQILLRDPWVASSRPLSVSPAGDGVYTIDLHLIDPEVLVKVQAALNKALRKPEKEGGKGPTMSGS